MTHFIRTLIVAAGVVAGVAVPAAAQNGTLTSPDGRKRVMAIEVQGDVQLDGQLDEAFWGRAEPAAGFVQSEPREGEPSSEETLVRVAFDGESLYIGALCRDSSPEAIIINEIREDFAGVEQDTFEVLLDTFADRRNGYVFLTNAEGAKSDSQVANEGRDTNPNWDAVWWVATSRSGEGWTLEMRIPFTTLRFQAGDAPLWGINFSRRIRRKNEVTYWSPVSRAFNISRASSAGDLGGLPNVGQGRDVRIKPFAVVGAIRPDGGSSFDRTAEFGVDAKLGVTDSMTLDLTLNPDFAQAEADEQQVNLTQFSLFFPEKREFFLENSGIFYFGDIRRNQRNPSRFRPPEEDLLLFFSRRIGLDDRGQQIPLYGGARLTGRAGRYGLGAMTIQSEGVGGATSNNYSVFRLRRDILANSDVGAIFVSRQGSSSDDFNRVVGLDANFRFFKSLNLNSFAARSMSPGVTSRQGTAKGAIGWEDSSKRIQYQLMTIGENFRDDLGFVRRTGVTRHFYDVAFMPRPRALRARGIREIQPHARTFNYYDPSGQLVTRQGHAGVQVTWEQGSWIEYAFEPRVELITVPFRIRSDVAIPAGRYAWNQHLLVTESDHSKKLSGSARLTFGDFWSGRQISAQISALYRPTYRLVFDLGLQRSDISLRLPDTAFVTTLVSLRTGYSFSTNMFLDSLVQYRNDVKQFSANIRFNVIHRPLSDFFVVYNEQQFTDLERPAGRGIVVKYTQMLAF